MRQERKTHVTSKSMSGMDGKRCIENRKAEALTLQKNKHINELSTMTANTTMTTK